MESTEEKFKSLKEKYSSKYNEGSGLNRSFKDDMREEIKQLILSLINNKEDSSFTIAIATDVSGSMRGERLERAKAAANSFIDSSNIEDRISLVSFSSNARAEVGLSKIMEGRDKLRRGIDSLSTGGQTNIGAGIEIGLNQLFSGHQPPKNPIIILLSDGQHNTGQLWPAVEKCIEKGVKIKTVAFGSDADQSTLQEIAKRTGGQALSADLKDISHIYHQMSNEVQNRSTLFEGSDLLKKGERLNYPFLVSADNNRLTLFTNWAGSRVLMELTDPNGKKIIPHESNEYKYIEEATYSILEIEAVPGEWQMELQERGFPPEGEQINISVSGESPLYTNFMPLQTEYSSGDEVNIMVETKEVQGLKRIPLEDIEVKAKIRKPPTSIAKKDGGNIEISLGGLIKTITDERDIELTLYDNKDDGIFANTFSDTENKGPYLITIIIKAELEDGQQINRQITKTFRIGAIDESELTVSELLEEAFTDFLREIISF